MIEVGSATVGRVPRIVELLRDDELGRSREDAEMEDYLRAFEEVSQDPNQILVVCRDGSNVVATLQLTIIPGLGRGATKRALIESARVDGSLPGCTPRSCRDRGRDAPPTASSADVFDNSWPTRRRPPVV